MNVLPQNLIGKVIKDCYIKGHGGTVIVIEFTDGSRVEVFGVNTFKSNGGAEKFLDLKTCPV